MPDERLNRLVEIDKPASVVPAVVEIVDIAGLVKGASKGEGLGNKFLSNIREIRCDYSMCCAVLMTIILCT